MQPQFEVSVGGSIIKGPLIDRNLEITVNDSEGMQSDSCSIILDDRDGKLIEPEKNDILKVRMGYISNLRTMGLYTVDQTELSGMPAQLSIEARAADLTETFKQQRRRSYNKKEVSGIISDIAKRNGLQAKVIGSLGSVKTTITQDGVSDMHMLTQLGQRYDAIATVKGGKLIFAKKGEVDMGTLTLAHPYAGILSYSRTRAGRPAHQKAEAVYWDKDEAALLKEEFKSSAKAKAIYGEAPYQAAGKDDAKEVSKARADALNRSQETLSLSLVGNPLIVAEMKIYITGLRAGINGLWRIKSVTHTINSSGYITDLEAEKCLD